MKNTVKQTASGLVVVVVGIATLIGLVFGIGWVANRFDATVGRDRLDVESRNREASYERQQSLIDSAQRQVIDYRRLDPASGQAKAIATQVCSSLAKVRGDLPTDLADFDMEVC